MNFPKPTESQIRAFLGPKNVPSKIPDDAWLIDKMACTSDSRKIKMYDYMWIKLYGLV
jgi:hypothetical protein